MAPTKAADRPEMDAMMVLGVWAATPRAAELLASQQEHGLPWFTLGRLPVYPPRALFAWWHHYEAAKGASSNGARRIPGAGRLDFFQTALVSTAGYGIRARRIAQSPLAVSRNHAHEAIVRRPAAERRLVPRAPPGRR
jgi:type IV secretory pathway TraG/TraD family ATPase VirD4